MLYTMYIELVYYEPGIMRLKVVSVLLFDMNPT